MVRCPQVVGPLPMLNWHARRPSPCPPRRTIQSASAGWRTWRMVLPGALQAIPSAQICLKEACIWIHFHMFACCRKDDRTVRRQCPPVGGWIHLSCKHFIRCDNRDHTQNILLKRADILLNNKFCSEWKDVSLLGIPSPPATLPATAGAVTPRLLQGYYPATAGYCPATAGYWSATNSYQELV
jgi:hypothetical protein